MLQDDAASSAQPEFSSPVQGLVPSAITRALGDGADPRATWLSGAVLIADVAGYTPLTERLSELGDEGLGLLSDLLNRHFSRYLEEVNNCGGELVTFSGDAVVAAFLERPGLDRAVDRAASCARVLSRAVPDPPAVAGTAPVIPHLGIAEGPIWAARLGGWFGRWELLVGGGAVRQAFAAASAAGGGEVVTAPAQPAALQQMAASPLHAYATAGEGVDWIRGLIHPRVLEAVAERPLLGAELRNVVTLFVRAAGMNEAEDGALERYQAWTYAIHHALRSVSAGSGRLLIDHHGLLYVLVLGDPGNAHPDDPDRVLGFASELLARAADLRIDVRMGFASGRAFCGVIGNPWRRDYMVIGPPLNLAARLAERSPRGLLAALPLPRYDRARFTLVPGDALRLKGMGPRVRTVHLAGSAAEGGRSRALLGRREEQRRLGGLLERAARGVGGAAIIIGEPGMGKSTLARWVASRAEESGLRCLMGEADLREASAPYFAFRPIALTLIGGTPRDDAAVLADRLRAVLEPIGRGDYAPLFNALLPLQLPETAITRQLHGARRAQTLGDVMVEVVQRSGEAPLVIVVEDAHWLDSASTALLGQIHARAERTLIVLTTRPEGEAAPLALSPDDHHPERPLLRVELGPLNRWAISGIARATLGASATAILTEAVEQQTAGNPLFVEEFLRELRDSGRLVMAGGSWDLAAGPATETADPSPTLRGLIAGRIDGLPPTPRRALKVAAVIGHRIDLSLLTELLKADGTEGEVADLVDLWARHGLVMRDGVTEARQVQFAHRLIQSVAYDSIIFARRLALHRSAALALEQREQRTLGDRALLVHHWSLARDVARTLAHAEVAAEEAVRAGAHREAREYCEMCIRYAEADPTLAPPTRRLRWEVTLGDAAVALGDVQQRGSHALNALSFAGRRIPRSAASAILIGSGALAAHSLRRTLHWRRTPADQDTDPSVEYVARAYRQLAQVSFFENEPYRYLCFAALSMVHAERAGQTAELSGALAEVGGIFRYAGFPRLGRRYFGEAFELAERCGQADAIAHVNLVHALASVGLGRWDEALASANRCQAASADTDNRVEWGNGQVVHFWLHFYRGRFADAKAAARLLSDTAREFGNKQQLAWGLLCEGICCIAEDRSQEACDLLQQGADLLADGGDPTARLNALSSLALARVQCGDTEVDHALAHDTMQAFRALRRPMGHSMTTYLSHLAEVLVEACAEHPGETNWIADGTGAVALLKRQAAVFPTAVPCYRFWQGRLQVIGGGSGRRPLRRGLRAARKLGMAAEARRIRRALHGEW